MSHDLIATGSNGLKLIARRMTDADSVTAHVFVGAGARHEDFEHEYGVSHFLEHLLFRGSERYPLPKHIYAAIDGVGGYHNAYTTHELTTFFIKVPKDSLTTALDVLADLVQRPLFDPREIDRERGVILEEMNVYRDDPSQHVFDYVGGLLWPQNGLRSDILGSEDIIRSIPPELIRNYHAGTYTPDNVVVSVAGNVKTDILHSLVEDKFGAWQGMQNHPRDRSGSIVAPQRMHIFQRETNQAHLVMAARGVPLRHPDEAALKVLTAILGRGASSRLYASIREERGLAYVVDMRSVGYTDTGEWTVYAGVRSDSLEEVIAAVMQELRTIREQVVGAEELTRIKQLLRGRVIMGQETNAAVADRLGSELLLTGSVRTMQEMIDAIMRVTAEDIQRVAQLYLDPSAIRLSIIAAVDDASQRRIEQIMNEV